MNSTQLNYLENLKTLEKYEAVLKSAPFMKFAMNGFVKGLLTLSLDKIEKRFSHKLDDFLSREALKNTLDDYLTILKDSKFKFNNNIQVFNSIIPCAMKKSGKTYSVKDKSQYENLFENTMKEMEHKNVLDTIPVFKLDIEKVKQLPLYAQTFFMKDAVQVMEQSIKESECAFWIINQLKAQTILISQDLSNEMLVNGIKANVVNNLENTKKLKVV
jgi:hypothetical protein